MISIGPLLRRKGYTKIDGDLLEKHNLVRSTASNLAGSDSTPYGLSRLKPIVDRTLRSINPSSKIQCERETQQRIVEMIVPDDAKILEALSWVDDCPVRGGVGGAIGIDRLRHGPPPATERTCHLLCEVIAFMEREIEASRRRQQGICQEVRLAHE